MTELKMCYILYFKERSSAKVEEYERLLLSLDSLVQKGTTI